MRPTMRVACNFLSFVKARRAELACLSLFLFLCTGTPTGEQVVRFLRFDDVAETLELFAFMEAADESKRRGGAPVKLSELKLD